MIAATINATGIWVAIGICVLLLIADIWLGWKSTTHRDQFGFKHIGPRHGCNHPECQDRRA